MIMDSGVMMSVQIAIIGIVVVVGLFVLWRRIARLEERVEALSNMQRLMGCGGASGSGMEFDDHSHTHPHQGNMAMADEDIMAAIFDMPLSSMQAGIMEEGPRVTVVDEEPEHAPEPDVEVELETVHMKHSSEAESAAMSKSKLRKMQVEELKEILEAKGLSADGNKVALIDRILEADS